MSNAQQKLNTEYLRTKYNTSRLTLAQVCTELNMPIGTAYQQRHQNKFPVPMAGKPLKCSVDDLAAALEKLRDAAH